MQDIFRFKNGPFSQKAKKHNLMRLKKRSSFITDFFYLQLDTATFIIQSFRMIKAKARGCKQRFKSDTWYLVGLGFTCDTIIQYLVV